MSHPFHPWAGREFLFLSVGHNWGENRVFFLDDAGVKHSLPAGWTDVVAEDAFVTVAAGRCTFRANDLLRLADLVAQLAAELDGAHGVQPLRCANPGALSVLRCSPHRSARS